MVPDGRPRNVIDGHHGHSEHFGSLVTWVTVRRIVVGIAVLCSVVGVSPASAQTYVPSWYPDVVEVAESSGTVVLTLLKGGPGQVRYRTEDGGCRSTNFGGPSPPTNCGSDAHASEDYGAVSGQVVFTGAGSKQITVPIVDDRLDERPSEAFTVIATEVDERGGWVAGTNNATVRIIDDEGDSAGEPAPAPNSTTTIRRPAPGSGPIVTVPPLGAPGLNAPGVNAPPPPTTSPASHRKAEMASEELRPGPGFELTMDRGPLPAPNHPDGKDRSATSLALGLGTAAAVLGGSGVWMRRRRRWSPTQA